MKRSPRSTKSISKCTSSLQEVKSFQFWNLVEESGPLQFCPRVGASSAMASPRRMRFPPTSCVGSWFAVGTCGNPGPMQRHGHRSQQSPPSISKNRDTVSPTLLQMVLPSFSSFEQYCGRVRSIAKKGNKKKCSSFPRQSSQHLRFQVLEW